MSVSGDGIQVSAHRYGVFTNNVVAVEVVLGNGDRVVCDPTHSPELFWGTVSGAGTVALVTTAQFRIMTAGPFVRSTYKWFDDVTAYVAEIDRRKGIPVFLEGLVFGPRSMVLIEGNFMTEAGAAECKVRGEPVVHPGPLPECGTFWAHYA